MIHKIEISDFPDEGEFGIVRGVCSCGAEFSAVRKEGQSLDDTVRAVEGMATDERKHRHRPNDWRFS